MIEFFIKHILIAISVGYIIKIVVGVNLLGYFLGVLYLVLWHIYFASKGY